MEKIITSTEELRSVLRDVAFRPSCVDFGWEWQVEEIWTSDEHRMEELRGWFVRTSFRRPDTETGEVQTGYGRWEFVERGSTESSVVKTCWLLAELIVRHELMEAFSYQGKRVFDPHKPVFALTDESWKIGARNPRRRR